jgi:uncharacterized membrane protein YbhN (UPF0104 family)
MIWKYGRLFGLILNIDIIYVMVLLVLFVLVQFVNGYKLFMIVRFFGANMTTIDWIALPYVTSYLNFLPINAGSGATAVFLKKKYELPYTKFVSISGTLLLMELFCLSTSALLVMGLIGITRGEVNSLAVMIFLGISVAVGGLRFVPVNVIKGKTRFGNWVKSALDGFGDLRRSRGLMVNLMINSYVQLGLLGLIIYATFLSLGLLVNYLDGLLLGIVTSVSKYHFLFPGQFGIREMVIASVTKIVQGSFEDGVVVAVTDRIISGAATIVLGNIFILTIIKRMGFGDQPEGRF